MKKFQKIFRKLSSRSGESIAEVLVATLIAAVALVMLASMIASSTSMIEKSRDSMKKYYEAENSLIGVTLGKNGTVSVEKEGNLPYAVCPEEAEIPIKYAVQEAGSQNVKIYIYERK